MYLMTEIEYHCLDDLQLFTCNVIWTIQHSLFKKSPYKIKLNAHLDLVVELSTEK